MNHFDPEKIKPSDVAFILAQRLRGLTRATIVLYATVFIIVGAIGLQVRDNGRRAREGKQAHDAICALQTDYRARITEGKNFLDKHPDGIPGIDANTIRVSLKNQEATLYSLRIVTCK